MIISGYITARTVDITCVKKVRGAMKLYNQVTYKTQEFSNLDSLLKLYMKKISEPVDYACFGVAGPVIQGEVQVTNLPWQIKANELSEKFSLGKVKLLNDLVATAHGVFELPQDKFIRLNVGESPVDGNMGMIAAGNGLGQSLIYRDENNYYPYASEGGHGDFSPSNQLEMDLWEYLYSDNGHVEIEDVLSFSGIENIFRFLLFNRNAEEPEWLKQTDDRPQKIIEMCLSGEDDLAIDTIEIFIGCFASEAANLALKGMTLSGIYIGGMIAKQVMTSIDKGRFMERFIKKGKMENLLEKMPVSLIIDEKTALLGAASFALKKVGE